MSAKLTTDSNTDKVEQNIETFIKSFEVIEDHMEVYKEQKRDLRKDYLDNHKLDKDQMRMAVKAYRLMKGGDCMDQLSDFYAKVCDICK
jgi:hypothetical protein